MGQNSIIITFYHWMLCQQWQFVLKPVHIATFCYCSAAVVGSVYLKHLLYNPTDSFQIDCEQLAGSSYKIYSAVKITLDYVVVFPFFTVAVMNYTDLYF